jgi:hypothetical protein
MHPNPWTANVCSLLV